ncbi:NEAT domain-containing protein [Clostridium sp.]|uniref:NEAT domain-containing protein n=1 Tax=Clostridium sp. TaxID=1506 RepID=UPI00290F4A97|nr:NEAT domain-containing protein [Clostridium sp.]MDU3355019.1 heme-binding Shp domain-containing protein [Clostridium sp.]
MEGKLYTIKNKVTHSNPTGQAMARQYLNESSSLEEIDGKYYLTLTFTGMDYMSNHKFIINGKEVSAKASKIDDKTTKYRFQIPSLDVTIKVSTYVAPMGRNVDFDVTLLKDTKAFVKEFTVEKLPQTGGALSNDVLLGMGTAMLGAAGLLKRKKK